MAEKDYVRLAIGGAELSALISDGGGSYHGGPAPVPLQAPRTRRCDHPKPLFKNGKERKVCFACFPKAEPKPRKRHEFKSTKTGACAVCSAQFLQLIPAQRFCSGKCRVKAGNRAKQERRRNSEPRDCQWCGTTYVPQYGSLRRRYCTAECYEAKKRHSRSGSTHRRRVRKFGVDCEQVDRIEVFHRDGWMCRACGKATPREAVGSRRLDAPELDHVVPLSKGGPHSYENTQCLCRACNRLKGSKTMTEFQGALVA